MSSSVSSGDRSGSFLCSGHKGDFNVTGELGQPVYGVAIALREAIRRFSKADFPLAHFLAIPQANETGERIDWYADPALSGSVAEGTTVINWSNATDAEKEVALPKLLAFRDAINSFSAERLQKHPEGSGDKHTFAKLLPKVLITPSCLAETKGASQYHYNLEPSYIFLVGPTQQPVLAFWGFSHPQSATTSEPLHFLSTPAAKPIVPVTPAVSTAIPATTPPEVVVPVAAAPVVKIGFDWWLLLRWLLLLLLLLLCLFFVWRSCSQPPLPSLSMPDVRAPTIDLNAHKVALPAVTTPAIAAANNAASGLGNTSPTSALAATTPENIAAVTLPNDIAVEPSLTPPNVVGAASEAATTVAAPNLVPNTALTDPALMQLGPELSLPPELNDPAMANYLNGQWNVYGIQDQQTGRPVRLEYVVEQGKGQVRVQQANGVSCHGPVQATGQNAALLINSSTETQCDDGSRYQMPAVQCQVNANQQTECLGRYDESTAFPISMRQAYE